MGRFLVICWLLSHTVLKGQDQTVALDELVWNPYYRLQWTDFQGEPDRNSLSDAGTTVRISALPFIVNKRVMYDVEALFIRSRSWVRDASPSLLRHEQLHFDIAELYARKIRKRVEELQALEVRKVEKYNAEIKKILEESNAFDRQYDIETLHGALQKKQDEWERQVSDGLEELKRYRRVPQVIGTGGP